MLFVVSSCLMVYQGLRKCKMNISSQVVSNIVDWIDNNIEKPLQIKDVAEHAGYSIRHFQRIFSCYHGVSPRRYIRERRLNLAAQLLLNTDMSVYEICLKYGFSSQQAFTRMFTRLFRCSPALYRIKFRAGNGKSMPSH